MGGGMWTNLSMGWSRSLARAAWSSGASTLIMIKAGVSGVNFPPRQSMPHASSPRARREAVSRPDPQNSSRANGLESGVRLKPSREKDHPGAGPGAPGAHTGAHAPASPVASHATKISATEAP